MATKSSHRNWWVLFTIFSVLLFAVYMLGVSSQSLKLFLEGLSAIKHFGIHYVVGIFTAVLVCIAWLLKTKRRAIEPMVLLVAVFVSHFPDFRFAFRRQEHEAWEVIFLGHTLVDDNFYPLFYILIPLIAALLFLYSCLLKSNSNNNN